MEKVTFYFSFRSPYAWLAHHRLDAALAGLPVEVEHVPVFPPPGMFANDPTGVPAKLQYIFADAARIADAYGLTVKWPSAADTSWIRPHAAWYAAHDAGRADAFARAVFAARFSEGRDVGADDALRDAALRADVDPAAALRAADDPAVHQRVFAGMQRAVGDGIFGVPYFAYGDERFWGNDRIDWLVRAIRTRVGLPVSDLRADPCAQVG